MLLGVFGRKRCLVSLLWMLLLLLVMRRVGILREWYLVAVTVPRRICLITCPRLLVLISVLLICLIRSCGFEK